MSMMHLLQLLHELVTTYVREVRLYDELSRLDDHVLADIGLERANLRGVARTAARLSQAGVVSLAQVQAAAGGHSTSPWPVGHSPTVRTV